MKISEIKPQVLVLGGGLLIVADRVASKAVSLAGSGDDAIATAIISIALACVGGVVYCVRVLSGGDGE